MSDASRRLPPRKTATSSDLVDAFVALADTLVAGYDVLELLQDLVDRATALLDVTAAGLLLADSRGRLSVAASSSDAMRLLELLQLRTETGPCVECFVTGEQVVVGRPGEAELRWPAFSAAMHEQGLLSVAAVPLRLRERTLGTLGLFTDRWEAPSPDEVLVAQGLADIATIGILQERAVHDSGVLAAQLQTALDSRVLVEQAKGVVAAQAGTSVAEAFQLLRTSARSGGVRLSDLAQAVVTGRITASQMHRG